MAYLALYREWRPKTFQEIVGQEHVRVTLTNALLQNKVAHAYLFSGPRGTGKTTAAKVLAKALNCMAREGAEPCNQCLSCRNIDMGIALDVLEIDAASNRGIDEIRDLRDKIKFSSSEGKYKIYIIDEVHMLTNEAFNALLKTLEEPPANVVFVLATTEAHKVPLTILSRVQRFEFHRIPASAIASRLKEVCRSLGREIDDKALQVVALKAEGGLRDALSILDQCLLLDDPIREEHVYQIIGMVGEEFSADLTDCLLEQNYAKVLQQLEKGVSLGRDPRQIIRELLDYLRQALLYITGGIEPLLAPETAQRLMLQSKEAGLSKLISLVNVLLKGENDFRYSSNVNLSAEMILIQALYELGNVSSQTGSSAQALIGAPPLNAKSVKVQEAAGNKKSDSVKVCDLTSAVLAKWPHILEEVKKKKKSTHAFLLEGKPASVDGEVLQLIFKEGYSFHKEKFNQPENKQVVEAVLENIMGCKLKVNSLMENEYRLPKEDKPAAQTEDLCIVKAADFFGAELVQVNEDN
jgi:DNA polymerase-3 subunit gamma/tau